jgi:N-acetylmuramoyl-L-alanine amidase
MQKLLRMIAVLAILSFFGECAAATAPAANVTVRFSKHEGFSRIVFETADESFVTNSAVTAEKNQIRVLFPSAPSLKPQGNVELETAFRGNLYTITVNSPFRIKTLKLSSPPRLSIDIIAAVKDEGRKPLAAETPGPVIAPNIKVVIDPGHGGYEVGIVSGDLREKDVTFSVARSLEATLLKRNRSALLTRKADQFLSITDRALFVNQKGPDVFISIHLSMTDTFVVYTTAADTASADAINELYGMMSRQRRYGDKSKALAEGLGNVLKEEFKRDIIFRKMDLPLLASVGAASIMVELPVSAVSDQSSRTRLAEALLKGIAAYASQ